MTRHRSTCGTLINAPARQAILLTLITLILFIATFTHADPLPPAVSAENQRILSDVQNYLRKQGMSNLSLLPGEVRQTVQWFSGTGHSLAVFGDESEKAQDASSPLPSLTQTSSESNGDWGSLDGQIHHKGFLPTHDALLLGSNVKMGFVGDRVQFALHPFFGQGWIPSKHYWGTNLSLNIAPRADGMPWGSIVMGYVGGDESLTDHGRGMNLHGDVDLTNGFLFTSGIRQNSLSGNANYALVKWKASLD